MPVGRQYQTGAEGAIASYDAVDLGEGTGITKLFGYESEASGAITHKLGRNAVYSSSVESVSTEIADATWTQYLDLDFDLSAFNLPKIVKGTCTININLWGIGVGGGNNVYAFVIATIKKGDTPILVINSPTKQHAAAEANYILNLTGVIPQTHFKKGDSLRLTIEVWAKRDAAGSFVAIGHDPQNRDGVKITPSTAAPAATTKLEFYVPFKIDL